MKTTGNTVLITGGSAGIGFAIAELFSKGDNQVIITGRDKQKLQEAASRLKNVTAVQSNVSNSQEVEALAERLYLEFPGLNIVVNNAGQAFVYNLFRDTGAFEKAGEEMLTNYLSVIRLNEKLLPLLKKQQEAAIVNVSSIVSFAPNHILSTYGASKAALHSYTQSLRLTLQKDTNIKVFELMPPLVNTQFSKEIGGDKGIAPEAVAASLMDSLTSDTYEIHTGRTADLYRLYLTSPADALSVMNPA